jgi:hypothetical protein
LLCEEFAGINTQMSRAGVPDAQLAWCDGFMPIAKRNLRTLYGIGPSIYDVSAGLQIRFFGFYTLNNVEYAAVFLSDGSVVQVNVITGAKTTIAAAGTILNPIITNVGFTDYNETYLVIVANQNNGYWLWDGALLYPAGGLSPIVTLTNVGAAYKTVPFVTATGGSGHGATFVATIANGVVASVTVTNPGTGYLPGQVVTLQFTGGNAGGSGGVLTANLSSTGSGSGAVFNTLTPGAGFTQLSNGQFAVSGVTISNGGSGYSQFTTLTLNISGAIHITVAPVLQPVISGGVIIGVTIVNGGQVIETGVGTLSATVVASDAGAFVVSSVTINNSGSGYSASATAVCSGGGSPVSQAVLQLVLNGSGAITAVTVASRGLYGSNSAPAVTIADAPVSAAGTVELMPFGVNGTAAELYAGHVWVINGPDVNATAPGSPTDFATSNGGVSFTSNNAYTQLVNTNGFLYLVGDSATDYVSGVTTTTISNVPTTQYTFLNADPEVGTPYPASVLTFGNYIILANSVGVHFLAGSTFTKISDELDGSGLQNGLWESVPNFGGNQLSASKATIFNKKVWMVLSTIVDPFSGVQVNKLFMWDGKKWWASEQDNDLTFIASSEFNSVLTAYGTDGDNIFPLFQQPSTGFTKVMQTRLWDAPGGYTHNKAAVRLFGIAYYYNPSSAVLAVFIDNETSQEAGPYNIAATGMTWVNNLGQPMNWVNNLSQPMTWSSTGYAIFPPEAIGQQGVLTGLTAQTSSADMSIVSLALQDEVVGYRG